MPSKSIELLNRNSFKFGMFLMSWSITFAGISGIYAMQNEYIIVVMKEAIKRSLTSFKYDNKNLKTSFRLVIPKPPFFHYFHFFGERTHLHTNHLFAKVLHASLLLSAFHLPAQ